MTVDSQRICLINFILTSLFLSLSPPLSLSLSLSLSSPPPLSLSLSPSLSLSLSLSLSISPSLLPLSLLSLSPLSLSLSPPPYLPLSLPLSLSLSLSLFPLSLSLSLSLSLFVGSERIWVECFSGRWTKSVHNKKLFLNRKLKIQLLTFILLECFSWNAYLQAFRYCSNYLMSQISPFTPCGFYNAYLNNIAMLSLWGIAKHWVMASLFM